MRLFGVDISASASASTADPSLLVGDYEVFLNFCGQDTRYGFTDYLYTSLNRAGVRTFRDNEGLHVGKEIGQELLKTIEDSKISIPIFSKNYASKKWCLLELAHMVKCLKNGSQMILPIFYDVDPDDVQHQRGSYEEAFRQHRGKRRYDEKVIEEWKNALKIVGQLKGLELKKETGGHQGKLVEIIEDKVLEILKQNNKHEDLDLVGMPSRIEKMEELLNIHSDSVRFIGIHGMGGLGKTTIANVIYNKYQHHFDYHSFLIDVRETESRNGIVHLQKKLLSDIRKTKNVDIDNYEEGIMKIRDAVCGKNVLIVLDDVNEKSQVDRLAGSWEWFGARARIIITTRDEEVLHALKRTCHDHPEVYESYQPGYLDADESLELFSKHAFVSKSPPEGYDTLSKDVASTAAGLPLVLKVTGSLLYGETDKELWEEKIKELKNIPPAEVQEKLRLSFDPLTDRQKEIFLDIACLFIGQNKTLPCYMWDDCGFFPRNALNDLVHRSLITVGDDDILMMHDQLRDLGREIAREGKLDEWGRWSRLWDRDKALEVCRTGQGRDNVKALRLAQWDHQPCRLEGEKFLGRHHLRYLTLGERDTLYGDFEHCLPNLRWLRWRILSLEVTPTNLHLRNLVILDLSCSSITEDSELWSQIQMSKQLKVLDLSYCAYLGIVPILSTFSNLEWLDVSCCDELFSLDGIEELESLRHLYAYGCSSLETLPNLSKLKSLKTLYVTYCSALIKIEGLHKLESFEYLDIMGCTSLKEFPNLPNFGIIKELDLFGCSNLYEVEKLRLMESLESLNMCGCEALAIIDLRNLKKLRKLHIGFIPRLNEIWGLEELESLEVLFMYKWKSIEMLPGISNLTKLVVLGAGGCENLTEIRGLEELKSLEFLDIENCKSIKSLPDFSNHRKLKVINAAGCEKLTEIRGLENLESFGNLFICGCEGLNTLMYFQVSRIRIHTEKDDDYYELDDYLNDCWREADAY